MRRMVFICAMAGCLAITGCMAPRAQQYLDQCLAAGQAPALCEQEAERVNSEAWQGLGQGMQGAGSSLSAGEPAQGTTLTNCHIVGSTWHCTTY